MRDLRFDSVISSQPHRMLFVTISGAHLYGFPSPDSDYDLRGVHVLPLAEIVGLSAGRETIESSQTVDGLEIDLVTQGTLKAVDIEFQRGEFQRLEAELKLVGETTHLPDAPMALPTLHDLLVRMRLGSTKSQA